MISVRVGHVPYMSVESIDRLLYTTTSDCARRPRDKANIVKEKLN